MLSSKDQPGGMMIKSRQLFVPSLEVPWGHRRASFSTTNFRMALAKQPAQVDLATDFVIPEGDGNVTQASQALAKFIRQCKRVSFITGAGMSTASGIPDYRSPTGAYSKGHKPITHKEFVDKESNRQRYWSRSLVGYKTFASKKPNVGHFALSNLERRGFVEGLITQNVDGLHTRAGSEKVVELHGTGHVVRCLSCGTKRPRLEYETEMVEKNASWVGELNSMGFESGDPSVRPDGDADVNSQLMYSLEVVPCAVCNGVMKPDVVFFGDGVSMESKTAAFGIVDSSNGLVIAGSSVQVYSAFSLILHAAKKHIPIAVVNIGETRVDNTGLESLRLHERCDMVLPETAEMLS